MFMCISEKVGGVGGGDGRPKRCNSVGLAHGEDTRVGPARGKLKFQVSFITFF